MKQRSGRVVAKPEVALLQDESHGLLECRTTSRFGRASVFRYSEILGCVWRFA